MVMVYVAAGWLLGIFVGSELAPLPILVLLTCGLAAVAIIVLGRRLPAGLARQIGWATLALTLGLWRATAAQPSLGAHDLSYYNTYRTVQIVRGVVDQPPEARDRDLRLHLAGRAVWRDSENHWQPVGGSMLVSLPLTDSSHYRYGDLLELQGLLTAPPAFGGSYSTYLKRQGILSYSHNPDVLAAGKENAPLTSFYGWLFGLREAAGQAVNRQFPQPDGALLNGILLGDRTGLPGWLSDDFASTGTAQIVAISGQNMVYVLGFILLLADWRKRPRSRYALYGVALVAVYSVFVGASASVVRSAIMAGVVALAIALGESYNVTAALAFAAILMTAFNPAYLWDIGWQLSCVAILGLVYVAPLLKAVFDHILRGRLSRLRWLGGLLSVSIGAQLVTEPLIWMYFGQVSLISPLANIIAEPLLPLIMAFGAISVPLLLLWPPLAIPFAALAWVFLRAMIQIVEFCALLPFAALQLPNLSVWWVLAYYSALAAVVVWCNALRVEARAAQLTARLAVG